jgi:UDP-glucose 4-epimerase
MKILVTGGAGFIGTNLIKRLVSEGHEVISLDDYHTGNQDNHIEGCRYVDADIETIEYINGETIRSLNPKGGYDLCFHLAAISRVQPSFDDPTETFRVNVEGTRAVCEWARLNNVKVVYAGSSSKHHDPSDSPYSMFKYLGEGVCKVYKKSYNLNVEICRFYNVYGPNETISLTDGNVIGIWREQITKGLPLTIVGDGEQRRDFIHVDDIVEGLYRIGLVDNKHEDAWELGIGKNYSINQLFGMFKEKYPNVESKILSEQKGNYRETLNTNTDAIDRLGWKPQDRLEDYIKSL